MGNNPTGKTGKRYVSYPEPGVTKVYYENRVLVIRSDEDQKQYGAKLRAVQKQGHGKYPADVVFTPPAPAKPKRSVKSKAPAKRTAPARKKAVRKSADDVWGKPPAPVFAREEVKAAPRKSMSVKAGYVADNPKGKKYRAQLILSGGRVIDVGTASSEERAHDMISDAYDKLSPAQRRGVRWRIARI